MRLGGLNAKHVGELKQLRAELEISGKHTCLSEKQEPVAIGAYEVVNENGNEWELVYPAAIHKYKSIPAERITQTFYTNPVRTKDLTPEEIKLPVDVVIGCGTVKAGCSLQTLLARIKVINETWIPKIQLALQHKRGCAYERIDQDPSECTCGVTEAKNLLNSNQPVKQEPVAWCVENPNGNPPVLIYGNGAVLKPGDKLYAAPVDAKAIQAEADIELQREIVRLQAIIDEQRSGAESIKKNLDWVRAEALEEAACAVETESQDSTRYEFAAAIRVLK